MLRPSFRALLGLFLICPSLAFASGVPFPATENLPQLTFEQEVWLNEKESLRLGIPIGRPPLAYQNRFGRVLGTESGYVRLLERKLGVPIEMVGASPMVLEEKLARGEIDAVSMLSAGSWSSRQYRFTRPYMQVTYGIFVRQDESAITSLSSLNNRRIVLLDGDHYLFELLDPIESFTPVAARTLDEAMYRLMDEEADALLAPVPVGLQHLEDNQIQSVQMVQTLDDRPMALSYAVLFDQGILRGALDAAIASMTAREHRNIRGAWVGLDEASGERDDALSLNATEHEWLANNPDLKIGMRREWPPLEFVDRDQVTGLVPALIDLIEEELGVEFERVILDEDDEPEAMLSEGRVDVIPALPRTPETQDRYLFSSSYLSLPIALVIRDDHRFVGDLSELGDERVGVVKHQAARTYLRRNHPELNLEEVPTGRAGLEMVSAGELDIMVTHLPGVSHTVERHGLQNLRVSSITPYRYDLRLAVGTEQPTLASILGKTLAGIERSRLDEIYNRWIKLDSEPRADYTVVRRVLLLALLVLAVFLYWNRKLSREVNERLRSEQALRQSQEELRHAKQRAEDLADQAEEASRAKSQFLANMSHEIRTPMNSVIGYTELLERSLSGEREKGYLASIKAGSRSLLTLINDILDLSRVEAGKMRLEYGPLDLERLLEDVRHIFAIRASEKGIDLEFDLSRELPSVMVLDETRLRQVLFNLVGNAIKFTDQGRVVVRADWEQGDDPVLTLEVADTGIGIPLEQQERIFEAFEQQTDQSNRRYGGTGLGLAISRKLVEMMNGELAVSSTAGEGSTFTIRLHGVETALASPDVQSENLPVSYRFDGGRVIIVDDNPINRQLVRDVLEPEGLVVDEAENGAVALERARATDPDLVLMDIRMPVMNGFRARAAFSEDEQLRTTPVVALTASVMSSEVEQIRGAGFDGYLHKPVSRQDLLAELARFLRHEESRADTVEGGDSGRAGLTAWSAHPKSHRERIMERLEALLVPEARQLRDSGDPEALHEFARRVGDFAREVDVQELLDLARQLERAVSNFELDRVQHLFDELAAGRLLG